MKGSDGEIIRLSGITQDITDSKARESKLIKATAQANKANLAKSEFLANMSHEIRTPLGVISGFSSLAQNKNVSPDELNSYLEIIGNSSNQVLRIVDDILDLSKVEAGKIFFENEKFNFLKFLIEFDEIFQFRALEKGIQFELSIIDKLPQFVIADSTRVKQVLNNLVGNAIKFTQKGLVKFVIKFNQETQIFKFEVHDSGVGIKQKDIGKLFKPFSQVDPSATRKFGGAGLGLILSKKLCNHMEGDLYLKSSTYEEGSVFVAKIKLRVPSKTTYSNSFVDCSHTSAPEPEKHKSKLEGFKILLVDDAPENRMLYNIILTKNGALTTMASDGAEGLEVSQNKSFDLLIIDIQMPKLNGHELVEKLRELGYKVPIIALTAHAMKDEEKRAIKSGFDAYLTKPVSEKKLVSMASELLQSR